MNEIPWLKDLNEAQKCAVTEEEGPVLVIAGAGTGKTRTLAYRVAYLISRGVPAERILLLTFTRRAAAEMVRRASAIASRIAPELAAGTKRVWGGTFHATANRLLRTYGKAVGLEPNFTVLDRSDAADLMQVLRTRLGLASKEKRFPRKTTCLDIYSRCVAGGDPLAVVLSKHFSWCQDWEAELKKLFQTYVDEKARRQVLDYDDLLLFWLHLLEKPEVGREIEERFDHILVDEYQDTNRLQSAILRKLRSENHNIMVVGDDAQSIYSFRAAEVRNILDFPKQFPGGRMVTLEENYRSTQPILDVANRIISRAGEGYAKTLRTTKEGGRTAQLVTCLDEQRQSDFIAQQVLKHLEEGIPLMRQAVLFRIGHWSDHLEVELSRRNIPFHKYGGLKFIETAHVKDLVAFLRIVENPRDDTAWFRVLQLVDGIGPGTASKAVNYISEQGLRPEAIAQFPAPKAAVHMLREFGELFAQIGGEAKVSVAGQVQRVRAAYDSLLEKQYENPMPRLRDLDQLERIATTYRSRRRFLTDLTLDPPSSTADLAGDGPKDEDWLVLSTIHSAKGCEWDVVYVIHAADGIIPSDLATGDAAEVEEERRLLYVAVTRARDSLYVSYPVRYYHKRYRLGDGYTDAQLTRFLAPEDLSLFEHRTEGEEDIVQEEVDVTAGEDIRQTLRDMWD